MLTFIFLFFFSLLYLSPLPPPHLKISPYLYLSKVGITGMYQKSDWKFVFSRKTLINDSVHKENTIHILQQANIQILAKPQFALKSRPIVITSQIHDAALDTFLRNSGGAVKNSKKAHQLTSAHKWLMEVFKIPCLQVYLSLTETKLIYPKPVSLHFLKIPQTKTSPSMMYSQTVAQPKSVSM